MLQDVTTAWADVDEVLGPAPTRFFGHGYRRVEYAYGQLEARGATTEEGTLQGRLALVYPGDWSRKGERGGLPPHLSTVDAVLVGTELAELALVHGFRLGEEARRRSWVRRISVRAGTSPQEDLQDLPLQASVLSTEPHSVDTSWATSRVRALIGSMRVTLDVRHPRAEPVWRPAHYGRPDDLLGPSGDRYHRAGFRYREHRITDVLSDPAAGVARALVDLIDGPPLDGFRHGLDATLLPAPTLVDAFVVNLQLAQVLLYDLDDLDRAGSNTLWMRSAELTMQPAGADTARLPVTTTLASARTVPMGGRLWRAVDVTGSLGGARVTCALAHQLPG